MNLGKFIIGDSMKHEVDLSKYSIRTDLVIEKENKNFEHKEEKIDNIKITTTKLKENNMVPNKKAGTYVTIEFEDITDSDNAKKVESVFEKELKKLLKETKIKKTDSCLVVGLGNIDSTPDSIGPLTVQNIIVTNHIYLYDELDANYRRVSSIAPNVTAVNGIETADYIKGIVTILKPDFLIVIDALASRSIERVNKTIQLSNTGITPGSGVGNNRTEISDQTLNIPVIAIGIPTVVDAVSVVANTFLFMEKHYAFYKDFYQNPMSKMIPPGQINYMKKEFKMKKEDNEKIFGVLGTLEEEEIRNLIFEVLTPIGYNMIVTPKEVDFVVKKLSLLLSNGINNSIHFKKCNNC